MKSVGAKVREDVFEALVERARAEGVSISEIVRRALMAYLGKPVEQPVEAGVRELEELEARIAKLEELVSRTQSTASPTPSFRSSQGKGGERYVIRISREWATKKDLNTDDYMKSKERQGYVCNETSTHIICVWREELEQAVVDLNNSEAKLADLEKVLTGDRLNVARAAIEAGLLWFDSKEKRWRALTS